TKFSKSTLSMFEVCDLIKSIPFIASELIYSILVLFILRFSALRQKLKLHSEESLHLLHSLHILNVEESQNELYLLRLKAKFPRPNLKLLDLLQAKIQSVGFFCMTNQKLVRCPKLLYNEPKRFFLFELLLRFLFQGFCNTIRFGFCRSLQQVFAYALLPDVFLLLNAFHENLQTF